MYTTITESYLAGCNRAVVPLQAKLKRLKRNLWRRFKVWICNRIRHWIQCVICVFRTDYFHFQSFFTFQIKRNQHHNRVSIRPWKVFITKCKYALTIKTINTSVNPGQGLAFVSKMLDLRGFISSIDWSRCWRFKTSSGHLCHCGLLRSLSHRVISHQSYVIEVWNGFKVLVNECQAMYGAYVVSQPSFIGHYCYLGLTWAAGFSSSSE